ncbi:HAD-IIA family hydrolase [Pseudoroseomonas globiformis]|uniref:HAD-IIA family hydrolase n=1 Tax=Teichococcus globiformis TaxID=2307229 RepID=A0ABV7FX31_9PROT
MQRILEARGVLLDLDGTLISGDRALPGAAALVARIGARCAIVSNDAEHTPLQLSRRLAQLGFALPATRILLAGALAVEAVATEHPGGRLLLLASAALQRHARRQGLVPVQEHPDVVLLGRDRRFNYDKLRQAANAVLRGASLVVCNPDRTHPGPGGAVVPETGALLSALLACTGPVPHRMIGKPGPALFLEGVARLGTRREETVMVGDNPATDGVGATRLGIGFVPVPAGGFLDRAA